MKRWCQTLLIPTLFFLVGGLNAQKMENIEQHTGKSVGALSLKYLIKEPQVKPGRRQGIVLLHGVGSNEKDLFGLSAHLPDDLWVISAQGPYALGGERYAWYQVDFSTGKPVYNQQQEQQSRALIEKFIEEIRQLYQLDQIIIGGFSQGAIMSYA